MKSILHTRAFETAKEHGTIEFGLRYIRGNPLPYFTVTAAGREKDRRGAGYDFGGCCHELILAAAPDLKPLVDLHGGYVDGTPSHAEANGWYWLAGHLGGLGQEFHACNGSFPKTADEALEIFAGHARVDLNEARGLAVAVQTIVEAQGVKAARLFFAEWIKAQAPRWKAEADEAIERFNLGGWAA